MTRLQQPTPKSGKPGQAIGRYRILDWLGAGELGEVFAAGDDLLGRRVALRVLPTELAGDDESLSRVRRAVEAVSGLIHPNIVTLYGCEEASGKAFVVMELVPGRDLSRLIPPQGLPRTQLFEIAIPIAEVLAIAHERGIVHGDLRPRNVLVSRDGTVKVADFGLSECRYRNAAAEPSLTDTKPLLELKLPVESIAYRPPEQIRGAPPDRRSDIFSFGAILSELVTGRRPFSGDSAPEVVAAILRDPPLITGPREKPPRELAEIVERCLQKDPDLRPRSAAELQKELEDLGQRAIGVVSSAQVMAGGESAGQRKRARPKRSWLAAGSVAAAILVALVGLGLWRSASTEPEPSPPPAPSDPIPPAAAPVRQPQRVAVLPFQNLGPPEDGFLGPALAAEISRELASVEGLRAISPRSTSDLSTSTVPARVIGRRLGFDFLLAGSVQRGDDPQDPDRPALTARLVRVEDGKVLWNRAYPEDPVQGVGTVGALAAEVSRSLGGRASGSPARATSTSRSGDAVAYESYLRALDALSRARGREDLLEAEAALSHAVDRDPEFLIAHATLSRLRSTLGLEEESEVPLQRARRSLDRARSLGPKDGETRLAEAFYSWASGAEDRALEHFRTAARLLPSDPDAPRAIGLILRGRGQWGEALEHLERSLQLDPRGPDAAVALVETLSRMRRFKEARRRVERAIETGRGDHRLLFLKAEIELRGEGDVAAGRASLERVGAPHRDAAWQRRMLELDLCARDYAAALQRLSAETPATVQMALERAWVYRVANRQGEASQLYERIKHYLEGVVDSGSTDPILFGRLALAYAGTGRVESGIGSARRATFLLPVTADSWRGPEYLSVLARVYAMAGERNAAIEELWYLLSIPSPITVPLLRLDPVWDPLRAEPRFRELLGSGG